MSGDLRLKEPSELVQAPTVTKIANRKTSNYPLQAAL